MKNIFFIALPFLMIAAFSCEETVTLDNDQLEPMVVIEGLVTDQERQHYVRVTRSQGFYDADDVSGITDASVIVEDDFGNTFTYEYAPEQDQGADGYYFSERSFSGIVGSTYTLTVIVDDEVYTATDVLRPVTSIDSLGVAINRNEFENPEKPGYYYEVLIYAKEPQDRVDYYLFKFYRNDSIVIGMETDIYFVDDELFSGYIDGIPMAGFFRRGDIARLELYSLSRQAYLYYNDLYLLLTSDGGMFSPPPANPRNNISNGALGFFQASASAIKNIEVK